MTLFLQERYQKRQEELQHTSNDGTSTQGSLSTSMSDNEIYLSSAGGMNQKGNVYGLGSLSKRFSCTKSASSALSQSHVAEQIEEMRETIQKLNAELMTKNEKEKTLEETMGKLIEDHKQQSEQMRLQNERMEFLLQHFNIQALMPSSTPPTTVVDDIEHHNEDAEIHDDHDKAKGDH